MSNIDWPCEVKTLFREENLGCAGAISSGITWFFEHEKDGIILEDDCVPHISFFNYCEELLEYYKDNKKVWQISGNLFVEIENAASSYFFTNHTECWGWATWADRWQYFDFDLNKYYSKAYNNTHDKRIKRLCKQWKNYIDKKAIDTWALRWEIIVRSKKGLVILPCQNLVSNVGVIGHHSSADLILPIFNRKTYNLEKIIHPPCIGIDKKVEEKLNRFKYDVFYNASAKRLLFIFSYIKRHPLFFLRKEFWSLVT